MDPSFTGGHGVIEIKDLRLPADAVLGEIGKGFRYAQVRLAPARLSHCMRWLGAAVRAQDIATDYARTRVAFGKTLGEHRGRVVHAGRQPDGHAPGAALDLAHRPGCSTRASAPRTKARCPRSSAPRPISRVADRCMQILGGMGITRDTVVERFFRDPAPSASTTARPRSIAGRSARASFRGRCRTDGRINEARRRLETLAARRDRAFGAGAPLFYNTPLHIVRGQGVELFDPEGRRYVDMYNNVPCVGHANPHVAEAMARQQADAQRPQPLPA